MIGNTKPTGSTHHGLAEWLFMRLSAAYMTAFTIYVVLYWLMADRFAYETWIAWFDNGLVRTGWALCIGLMLAHGWFGMRSVFMDYVKPTAVRVVVSSLMALALMALAIWASAILLGVGA